MSKRLGFFTRLLDDAPAGERYRLAAQQIVHAERLGFDDAWVAQHHFNEREGGLPSPLVFLSYLSAHTRRIRLGTAIVTLPLELPVRVAEDAGVLDLISSGRLELGVGPGGNASAFSAFNLPGEQRGEIFARHLVELRHALAGDALSGGDLVYPPRPALAQRLWQATFSVPGGARAGEAGDGLMLSRTQPRPAETPAASLADIQKPIVDAYLAALPAGEEPRILASRSVFVADDRERARQLARTGLERVAEGFKRAGHVVRGDSLDDLLAAFDTHAGAPDEVIASLRTDETLAHATHVAVQVHSVDPPHTDILRSIELVAAVVAPALGWGEHLGRSENAPLPLRRSA